MAAPSLPVSAAALRRADLLFKKGDQASAPREAAYALLNDEGGTFDGGALLKKCLLHHSARRRPPLSLIHI